VRIHDFSRSDLPALLDIQARCPAAAQWQETHYVQLAANPGGMLLVALLELGAQKAMPATEKLESTSERVVGFCALQSVQYEAEMRNLAVVPEHQRQGVATALLEEAHRRLRKAGVLRVYLEVRASNIAARRLYAVLGYRKQSTRKDYYHEPVEDAETMLLEISR